MLPARLEPDADVGPGLPAAAELVGAVLQERAGELHRSHALVAESLAAMVQVLAVVLLGDREQAPGRALDRIAHRVVAEDVAEAGLLLEDRAGQGDGAGARAWPRAPRPIRSARRGRGWRARRRRRPTAARRRHWRRRPARGRSDGAAAARRRRRRPVRARAPRACAAGGPPRPAGTCARCASARGRAPGTRAGRRARCARPTPRRSPGARATPGRPDARSDWTAGLRRRPAASPLHRAPPCAD
jgi:hypothetical protein